MDVFQEGPQHQIKQSHVAGSSQAGYTQAERLLEFAREHGGLVEIERAWGLPVLRRED